MNETFDTIQNNQEKTYDFHLNKNKDELGSFFSRFFKIITIHKWLFLITILIILAVVLLYALNQPRSYQSSYEVFYNENVREFVGENSESTIVKSDFDKNYWLQAMHSDEIMRITQKNSGLNYTPLQLTKMIAVGVVDKRKEDRIPVFLVQITSEHKQHIPILIRAYINALNYLLLQNQVNNSQNLIAYLNNQINQNNQKLIQMDLVINNNGISSSEIVDFEKVKLSLDDFRKDLMNARVNLASIKSARIRTERELKNLDGTIVNESAFSEPLKVQLMNLEVDLARALTKNKENHPAVKQIKDNIQQIKVMLKDSLEQRLEIKSLIQNPLKNQLMSKLLELQIQEVSEETRVKSLEMVIAELERKTMPNSVNQDQQQQLRNRELISLTIKQLNDRLIETQSTSHGSLSRFVFIDDPNSIFLANKSLWFYLIIALCIGLIVASVVVLIYDMLDDRIMLVDDYEHFYKYPLIGVVRHYSSDEDKPIDNNSDYRSRNLNDLSSLIINLRQVIKHNFIKTIVVSSPDRQEGKSLVSLKIASALAMKKQKVLIVDMDFYSPKISSKLFEEMPVGLSNYILDEATYEEIIQPTSIEYLKAVSTGNADGQKDLYYNDSRLSTFVDKVKDEFDVIIFDTPAVMYIPDILEFFEMMDSILVVVRLRRTTRKLLDKIFKTFGEFKEKYTGVIVNDLNSSFKKYYSNYDYSGYENYSNHDSNTKKKRPVRSITFVVITLIVLILILLKFGLFDFDRLLTDNDMLNNNVATMPSQQIVNTSETYQDYGSPISNIDSTVSSYIDSVVVTKDTRLTTIAFENYGEKSFWVYIYLANKSVIKNPNQIEPGTLIYLPNPDLYGIDSNNMESINKAKELETQIRKGV